MEDRAGHIPPMGLKQVLTESKVVRLVECRRVVCSAAGRLHQVLQWHHFLSLVGGQSLREIRTQIVADGLFHVAVYLVMGVGLWMLAAFSTGFVLIVLWIVESFEPKALQAFSLKVKAKDPNETRNLVDWILSLEGGTKY